VESETNCGPRRTKQQILHFVRRLAKHIDAIDLAQAVAKLNQAAALCWLSVLEPFNIQCAIFDRLKDNANSHLLRILAETLDDWASCLEGGHTDNPLSMKRSLT